MTRLDGKGLLVRRRAGRLDVYSPAMSRDAYLQARAEAEVEALVEDFGDLALAHFARHISGSTRSGCASSATSPRVTDTRGLRRAEFAVAAFGATAFLLALLFVLDAVRFHGDVLGGGGRRAAARRVPRARAAAVVARALRPAGARTGAALRLARRRRASPRARADAGARAPRVRRAAGRDRAGRAAAGVLRRVAAPARVRLQRGRSSGSPRTSWPRSSSTRPTTPGAATRCGSWWRARSARRTR